MFCIVRVFSGDHFKLSWLHRLCIRMYHAAKLAAPPTAPQIPA
jgi:hypothetical protein